MTITTIDVNIDIKNCRGLEYLNTIPDNTIDLILTDPPYIISRNTGMNKHYNDVKFNSNKLERTDEQWIKFWEKYVKKNRIDEEVSVESENNKLSLSSPLARALIGKNKDSVVEFSSPKGIKTYSIKSVKYK